MPAETNRPETPVETNEPRPSEVEEQQRINSVANKSAKRGEETEKHYDQEHGIFTK